MAWSVVGRGQDQQIRTLTIISPALQQAVESSVAELEEATFGRGKWFDIEDDVADKREDIAMLREAPIQKTLKRTKFVRA